MKTMKRKLKQKTLAFLIASLCLLCATACTETAPEQIQPLPDGTYRGYYSDNGITQIGLEFTISQGVFEKIDFLNLRYRDGNYLADTATENQQAIASQFFQLTDALTGHGEEGISLLYHPGNIVDDADAVSGATLKSGKLAYALHDGLLRGEISAGKGNDNDLYRGFYRLDKANPFFCDGTYRGFCYAGERELLAIQFNLTDGMITSIVFRRTAQQADDIGEGSQTALSAEFQQAADDLIGCTPAEAAALCPATESDQKEETPECTQILAAAVINGLNHGLFRQANDTVLPDESIYADGSYQSSYEETGELCFSICFSLESGRFTSFDITDIRENWDSELLTSFARELTGQEISQVNSLPSRQEGRQEAYALCCTVWNALEP